MDEEFMLKLDEEHIKSLDLSELKLYKPACNLKHKEVSTRLAHLEEESCQQDYLLDGLKLQKSMLEKLSSQRQSVFQSLDQREKTVQQELSRINLMESVYKAQMTGFLKEFDKKDFRQTENRAADPDLNVLNATLDKQKKALEEIVNKNQVTMNDFADGYLN